MADTGAPVRAALLARAAAMPWTPEEVEYARVFADSVEDRHATVATRVARLLHLASLMRRDDHVTTLMLLRTRCPDHEFIAWARSLKAVAPATVEAPHGGR